MAFATLAEWLAWQEQLHPTEIELGLDRVKHVAQRLSFSTASPQPLTITVGGTNGKGSCVAYLESILREAGYRVGSYSSPHLLRYNERVRINGIPVEDQMFCDSFERVDTARGGTSLTYFEFGTLAALDIFHRAAVNIRVLEVGLGGRLDAVNIVEPDAAIVVNVDLDHEAWLGHTRELIGKEKAGIFRPRIPLVIGDSDPPQSLLLSAHQLSPRRSRCRGRDFDVTLAASGWSFRGLRGEEAEPVEWTGLPVGRLPLPSAACALQVLAELGLAEREAIARGISAAHLPGRFECTEWKGRSVVLDVAHNPAGAVFLAERLRQEGAGKWRVVFSALADKDYRQALAAVADLAQGWYLAPLPLPRAESLEKLRSAAVETGVPTQGFDTIAAALQAAVNDSLPGEKLLVFGSFYTVAEAMAHMAQKNEVGGH